MAAWAGGMNQRFELRSSLWCNATLLATAKGRSCPRN